MARWRRRLASAAYPGFPRLFRDSVTQWHDEDLREPPPGDLFDDDTEASGDELRSALRLDTLSYLPDDLLVKTDRCAMAASLEARAPFLAPDLVRFAWSLPDPWRDAKRLLRRVLHRRVPASLVDRPKQGFEAPIGPWLRGPLRAWAEDLLAPQRVAGHGLIDPLVVARCWSEHVSGRRDHAYRLWTVLMLQAWLAAEGKD